MMEFHPIADIFPILVGPEYQDLVDDIRQNGLLEPVWLYEEKILDGRNRYRACMDLGIVPGFRQWSGEGGGPISFVVAMNLRRRHLDSSQRAACSVVALPWLEEEARKRMMAGGGDQKSGKEKIPDPIENQGQSRDQAATLFGTNGRYVQEAKMLAQAEPELFEQVRAGEITIPQAKRRVRHRQRKERAQAVKDLPQKVYNVIYADPPWKYNNSIESWGPADLHYEAMDIKDICALPARQGLQIADDAVLFLWVTNPFLEDAFKVVKAWGFEYKTNIVWVKTNLQKPGSGFYVRGRHELLFICTRGNCLPLDANISPPIGSVLESPLSEHSRKPEETYGIIERLYPDCSYIELFARDRHKGWDSWGDELR